MNVRTVVSDPPPADFEAWLERRRQWGGDRYDELWAGELHVNPLPHGRHTDIQQQVMVRLDPLARAVGLMPLSASNIGAAGDYRCPDGVVVRPGPHRLCYPTAALALEVLSPGDETWDKLGFYAAHGVEELLVVDPHERTVQWLSLVEDEYRPTARSGLIELGPDELAELLDWPPLTD